MFIIKLNLSFGFIYFIVGLTVITDVLFITKVNYNYLINVVDD
jgi:hypothetical protein